VFDVNLRQSYYSKEILAESMRLADIVKLNDEELPRIMSLAGLHRKDELSSAQRLAGTYDLKLVCITRGGREVCSLGTAHSMSILDSEFA